MKTLLENQGYQLKTAKLQDGQTNKHLTKHHDHKIKGLSSRENKIGLGSLAWWGTALVRRRSRDQSPPEAPQLNS